MDGAGQQLLAGAGFTFNKYRHVTHCRQSCLGNHSLHLRTAVDDIIKLRCFRGEGSDHLLQAGIARLLRLTLVPHLINY